MYEPYPDPWNITSKIPNPVPASSTGVSTNFALLLVFFSIIISGAVGYYLGGRKNEKGGYMAITDTRNTLPVSITTK
jgi:hypothetical protein